MMSDKIVFPLESCGGLPVNLVGGKAHTLGLLFKAAIPVPDGVCLTTRLFQLVRRGTSLGQFIADRLSALQNAPILTARILSELRTTVRAVVIPEQLATLIAGAAAPLLEKGPVIVRSSAPNEDGTITSAAGIYYSSSEIYTVSELLSEVCKCWGSLFSEQAYYYDHGDMTQEMAVVIQLYVQSELSGVFFSQDPLHRHSGHLIEMNRGGNRSITEGQSANYRLDYNSTASAMPPLSVPTLLALAAAVERILAGAIDMEWSWSNDTFTILQARRITSSLQWSSLKTMWAEQEDVENVYRLPLGKCEGLFIRQLQKKVWYRQFCLANSIDIFRVFYLIYSEINLEQEIRELLALITMPFLRISWGDHVLLSTREHVTTALLRSRTHNLIGDGTFACVQLGEVIPATISGFSSRLANGHFLLEAFPNGITGIENGSLTPSTYIVDKGGTIVREEKASFDKRAFLDLERDSWVEEHSDRYELEITSSDIRRIVTITEDLAHRFGEIRLEWYIYNHVVYVRDLSIETHPILIADDAVLAHGVATGSVAKINDLRLFDELVDEYGISVIDQDERQDKVQEVSIIHRIRKLQHERGDLIIVAEYPSTGLIPLVRYAKGFVFARATVLCHMAIVMRENQIPGVVVSHALSLLAEGDQVSITSAGVTLLQNG